MFNKGLLSQRLLLLFILFALPLPSFVFAQTAQQVLNLSHIKNGKVTIILSAKRDKLEQGTNKSEQQLILSDVKGNLMYFYDRPRRIGSIENVTAFFKFWTRYFAACKAQDGYIPGVIVENKRGQDRNIDIDILSLKLISNNKVKLVMKKREHKHDYLQSPCGHLIINLGNVLK